MGCQVQVNGTPGVLSHGADALGAGDEGLHVFWTLEDVETQSTNREGSIGATAVAGVVSERDGPHRMARRLKCLNCWFSRYKKRQMVPLCALEGRGQEARRRAGDLRGRGRSHRIGKGVRLVGLGTDNAKWPTVADPDANCEPSTSPGAVTTT